jgi:hypothetical protein
MKISSTPFSINDILTSSSNGSTKEKIDDFRKKSFEIFDKKLKTIYFDSNNNSNKNNKDSEEMYYSQQQMNLANLHPTLRRSSLDCFLVSNSDNNQNASDSSENINRNNYSDVIKFRHSESPLDMRRYANESGVMMS